MKLVKKYDVPPIKELKYQPTTLLVVYSLLGILGFTSSFLFDSSASLRIVLLFISGLIIGLSTDKLVTKGLRKIGIDLRKEE